MHEMALMHEVVNATINHAESLGATSVREVCLTIGEGRDVIMPMMDGLFAHLTKGTIAEGATLSITQVPFTVQCRQCGTVFPFNYRNRTEQARTCPGCGAKNNYRIHSGQEFLISSIQIECAPETRKIAS